MAGANSSHDAPRGDDRDQHTGDLWLPQRVAAERVGVSVSAVRKWRGLGVVAERHRPDGQVEVRLADVEARAAQTMPGRSAPNPSPPTASPAPGGALVPIEALSDLFSRIADAEGRAARAEAELAFLRERIAERRPEAPPTEVPSSRRRWWRRARPSVY
jgi:hypothetical protein